MSDRYKDLARKAGEKLVVAILSAGMTLGIFTAVFAATSGEQKALARRVDQNTRIARVEAEETRDLLCDILRASETKSIKEAVARYCEAPG